MKLKLSRTVYAAYIKTSRFLGYFADAETAMKWLNENYAAEDKHLEPCWIFEEEKP